MGDVEFNPEFNHALQLLEEEIANVRSLARDDQYMGAQELADRAEAFIERVKGWSP